MLGDRRARASFAGGGRGGAPVGARPATGDVRPGERVPRVVLTDAAGHVLGSLCVYGDEPRSWTDHDVDMMTALAEAVADELEDAADQR